MKTLSLEVIKQQIANLFLQCPEVADDEQLKLDTLEAETVFVEAVDWGLKTRQDALDLLAGMEKSDAERAERKARFNHKIHKINDFLKALLEAAETRKVVRPDATVWVQASQPSLLDVTERGKFDLRDHPELKEEFTRTYKEINKSAITAAIKAGENIPGFLLSNPQPSLHIKVK